MKKILLTLLILVGVGGVALGARLLLGGNEDTWICVNNQWIKHGNPSVPMPIEGCGEEIVSEEEQVIGGDRDENGCLVGAGYSWCEAKQKCLRTWEEPCVGERTDEEMIKEALVTKHNWETEEVKISIAKNDGQYATGGVGSKTPQGGGGIWFAARVDDTWQIVWDGNGAIVCEDLADYPDFPVDLIPECYDSSINKTVRR